ncbi:MAG: ATP-binding protein [Kineosporiaceae bacterium]
MNEMERARLTLPARPESAGRARQWVGEVLEAHDLIHLIDTAALLVSELVTNALRHSGGPYEIQVGVGPTSATISVTDGEGGRPRRRGTAASIRRERGGDLSETGRGLLLVGALSDGWGWQVTAGGKRVWFRLTIA